MKFALALVAAFMVFQASSSPAPLNDIDPVGVVKFILKELVKDAEELLKDVDDFFNNYSEAEEEKIVRFVERIGYEITGGIIALVGKIFDDLEPSADEYGKKAVECVRAETEPIFAAVNASVDGITECILTEEPVIIKDGNSLFVALQDSVGVLQKAEENLENCTLGDICLLQLLNDLAALVNEIDPIVKGIEELIKGIDGEALPGWKTCLKTERKALNDRVVAVWDDIAGCSEQ